MCWGYEVGDSVLDEDGPTVVVHAMMVVRAEQDAIDSDAVRIGELPRSISVTFRAASAM
jgi:hypothetical protein